MLLKIVLIGRTLSIIFLVKKLFFTPQRQSNLCKNLQLSWCQQIILVISHNQDSHWTLTNLNGIQICRLHRERLCALCFRPKLNLIHWKINQQMNANTKIVKKKSAAKGFLKWTRSWLFQKVIVGNSLCYIVISSYQDNLHHWYCSA